MAIAVTPKYALTAASQSPRIDAGEDLIGYGCQSLEEDVFDESRNREDYEEHSEPAEQAHAPHHPAIHKHVAHDTCLLILALDGLAASKSAVAVASLGPEKHDLVNLRHTAFRALGAALPGAAASLRRDIAP